MMVMMMSVMAGCFQVSTSQPSKSGLVLADLTMIIYVLAEMIFILAEREGGRWCLTFFKFFFYTSFNFTNLFLLFITCHGVDLGMWEGKGSRISSIVPLGHKAQGRADDIQIE